MTKFKILGQEPAFLVGVLEAALALLLTFPGLLNIDQNQAAVIVAAVNAGLGLVVAYATSTTLYSALIGFAKAVLVLGAAFGANWTDAQTGAAMALITLIAGAYLRGRSNAIDTPISEASPGAKKEDLELLALGEAAAMRQAYLARPVQPSGTGLPVDRRNNPYPEGFTG